MSVGVPSAPSGLRVSLLTDTVGGASSSVIVITPVVSPAASSADRFDNVTVMVSSTSSRSSPATVTGTVVEVVPAANDAVPVAAV